MPFRYLASMDVEEAIRGNSMDGVVLMAGCDKTTPSLVIGAASCDLPAIVISGGRLKGRTIGSRTDVILRGCARRHHVASRFHGCRKRHVTLPWSLHDDGHRLHDGVNGEALGLALPETLLTRLLMRTAPGWRG